MPTLSSRRIEHSKADLVDGSADALFEIAIPTDDFAVGRARVVVSVIDGSNEQQLSANDVQWVFYNKTGTPAGAGAAAEVATIGNQKSTGTLTVGTWTFTAAAGKVTVGVTATSSLTDASGFLKAEITIDQDKPNAVTFL